MHNYNLESSSHLKILLVEDVPLFITIGQELLKGHDLRVAKTVAEAKLIFRDFKPDITFLDINLPDGTGHDILADIKTVNRNAFVIMVTASRAMEDEDLALKHGASGYILKPFSSESIKESIDKYRSIMSRDAAFG